MFRDIFNCRTWVGKGGGFDKMLSSSNGRGKKVEAGTLINILQCRGLSLTAIIWPQTSIALRFRNLDLENRKLTELRYFISAISLYN